MTDMALSGGTKVYGIIGDPVEHSLSPVFQSRFIDEAGLDAVYVPFRVRPEGLDKAVEGLLALGVQGFNVTVPHKQVVCRMLSADAESVRIGAVNAVKRQDDGWYATNTDWLGVRDVLAGLGLGLQETRVLMFGAGGTARAVVHALNHLGVARLTICNRTESRLRELFEHTRKHYPALHVTTVPWEQAAISAEAQSAGVLMNTTSIGLRGEAFPFLLAGEGVAVDAVYVPDGSTSFVRAAADAGRLAMDGLALLLAQGAASFQFWHGRRPDLLPAFRWLEKKLHRSPVPLIGWEAPA